MPLISATSVVMHYRLGAFVMKALKGVDVSIERGEFTAIAGPSGSGKTTLLNLIGCLEKPTSGTISIDGTDTSTLNRDQLTDLRAQKISFIFQNFNLLPVLTAQENVEYPLFHQPLTGSERARRAREALDRVGILKFAHHRPKELSGGQQQRVAIARAVVGNPSIVLADEPTANLDHAISEEILRMMRTINEEQKTTFVFSTHDPRVLSKANRVVRLVDGELE